MKAQAQWLSGWIVALLLQLDIRSSSPTCRYVCAIPLGESGDCHFVSAVLRRSGGRIVTRMEREDETQKE